MLEKESVSRMPHRSLASHTRQKYLNPGMRPEISQLIGLDPFVSIAIESAVSNYIISVAQNNQGVAATLCMLKSEICNFTT